MRHLKTCAALCCATAISGFAINHAAAVTIYGGATFTGGSGGTGGISSQLIQLNPGVPLITGGTGLVRGTQYYSSGATTSPTSDNTASYVFTATGVTQLGSIGTTAAGNPNNAYAYAINSSGMVSGYTADPTFAYLTPVLWNSAGTPTALSPLSVSSTGGYVGYGYALNDAGVVAGSSAQYGGGSSSLGGRPVFWAAGSTTPTALGIYGTGSYFGTNDYNTGSVQAINSSGTMIGVDEKFADSAGAGTGADLGGRATVWAAGGGAATELPNFGTSTASGSVSSYARVINSAGVVGGYAANYTVGGSSLGNLPVRWIPSGGTYTLQPLQTTGLSATGTSSGTVYGLNAPGDAVGTSNAYNSANVSMGSLPSLWKAGGTALTPLTLLGTNPSTGASSGNAYSINDAGFSVGNVSDYVNGGDTFGTTNGTSVAALWASNGTVVDLNNLIPTVVANSAASGWVILTAADSITNYGWIEGLGTYNPGGGLPDYTRAFLIQDSAVVTPEPASLAVLGVGLTLSARLRRCRN